MMTAPILFCLAIRTPNRKKEMELASASKNDSVHCEGSIKHEDELRELQLRWMK